MNLLQRPSSSRICSRTRGAPHVVLLPHPRPPHGHGARRATVASAAPDRETQLAETVAALLAHQGQLIGQINALVAQQGKLIDKLTGGAGTDHAAPKPPPPIVPIPLSPIPPLPPTPIPPPPPLPPITPATIASPSATPSISPPSPPFPKPRPTPREVTARGPGEKEERWIKANVPQGQVSAWEAAQKRFEEEQERKEEWIRQQMQEADRKQTEEQRE